ncbi:MAG: PspC domain-containing protein [Candidatus Cloacimonas sp.]
MLRFHRSKEKRIISGVCGGIAESINVNPFIIRLIFVVFSFAYGITIIAYIALMFILPEKEEFIWHEKEETASEEVDMKKLFRLKQGKKVGGVCTGLEAYFKIDVSIIRLLFILVTLFTSGAAAVVYLVLWIILPVAD